MNYQEIVENLRDEDVFSLLNQLGAQPIDKGNYFVCKTICHNEDTEEASQKLYYYKDTHLFYCYTECGAQSIFKLLKNYYETRNLAYDWYNDIYQVILNCSVSTIYNADTYKSIRSDYTARKARKELPTYPNEIIDVFTHYYPIEWKRDHISDDVMEKYNIRYSISQNKIIIPHYNINGDLVGIRGRALNPEEAELYGKYMPVQIEGKWYSHPLSLNLYGLNWNKDNIKNSGNCFIFESEKSVMQAESFNGRNCAVACCGSNINKYQIDLLMRYCAPREIVVCFDNEEKEGEDKYFTKLWKMCKKYTAYCNMSFVYDRNNTTKKKDSPSDNGEEIFAKLLKERIKVR